MKNRRFLLLFLLLFRLSIADKVVSVGKSGEWDDPSTWSTGQVPSESDDIVVASGTEVVAESEIRVNSLRVEGNLTLNIPLTTTTSIRSEKGSFLFLFYAELRASSGELHGATSCNFCLFEFDGVIEAQEPYFSSWNNPSFNGVISLLGTKTLASFQCTIVGNTLHLNFSDSFSTSNEFLIRGNGNLVNNLAFDYAGGTLDVTLSNRGLFMIVPGWSLILTRGFSQTGTLLFGKNSTLHTQGRFVSSGVINGEGTLLGDSATIIVLSCNVPSILTDCRVQGGSFHNFVAKNTKIMDSCSFVKSFFEHCIFRNAIIQLNGTNTFNGTLTLDTSQILCDKSANTSFKSPFVSGLRSTIINEGTLEVSNSTTNVTLVNRGDLISSHSNFTDLSSFGSFKILNTTTLYKKTVLAGTVSGNASLNCDCQVMIDSVSFGIPFYMTNTASGTWRGLSHFTELNVSNVAFTDASVHGENASFYGDCSMTRSSFESTRFSASNGSLAFDDSSLVTENVITIVSLFSFTGLKVQSKFFVLQNSNVSFTGSTFENCTFMGNGNTIFSGDNTLTSSSFQVMSHFYNKQHFNGAMNFTNDFFCYSCSLFGTKSENVVFTSTNALFSNALISSVSMQVNDSKISFNETALSGTVVTSSFLSTVSITGSFDCKDDKCLISSYSTTKCISCNSRVHFINIGGTYVNGNSSFTNLVNKGKLIIEGGRCTIEQCSFSDNSTVDGVPSSRLVTIGENNLCGQLSLPVTVSGTITCDSELSFNHPSIVELASFYTKSLTFNKVNITDTALFKASNVSFKGDTFIHASVSYDECNVSSTQAMNINSSKVTCTASRITNTGSFFMNHSSLLCSFDNMNVLDSTTSSLSTLHNSGTVNVHGSLDVTNLSSSTESVFDGEGLLHLVTEGFSTLGGRVHCVLESFGTLSFTDSPIVKEALIHGSLQGGLGQFEKLSTFQASMSGNVILQVKSSYACSGSIITSGKPQILLDEGCKSVCTDKCFMNGVVLNNKGTLHLKSSTPLVVNSSGSIIVSSSSTIDNSTISGKLESSVPYSLSDTQVNDCTMKGRGIVNINNVTFNNTVVHSPVVLDFVSGTASFTGTVHWEKDSLIKEANLTIASETVISSTDLYAEKSVLNFLGSTKIENTGKIWCSNTTWNFNADAMIHNASLQKLGFECYINSFKSLSLNQSNADGIKIQNHGKLSVSDSSIQSQIVNFGQTIFNEGSNVLFTQEKNGITVVNNTTVTGTFTFQSGELTGSGGFSSMNPIQLHDCIVRCNLGETLSFPQTNDGVFVLKIDGMTPIKEYSVFDLGRTASNYRLMIQFSFIPAVGSSFVPLVFQKENIPQEGTNWSFTGPFSPQAIQLVHNPNNLTITIVPCNGDTIINCVCPEQGFFFTEDAKCEECPHGHFSVNTSTTCEPCPNGTTTNDHITCHPINKTTSLIDWSSSSTSNPTVVTWVFPLIFFGILMLFLLFTRRHKNKKEIVVTLKQEPDELDQHDEPLLISPPVFPDIPVCHFTLFTLVQSSFICAFAFENTTG